MRSRHSFVLALLMGLLVAGISVVAAQAKPDYDTAKQLKLDATVTKYVLDGEHVQLQFDAPDEKNTVQHWTVEADNVRADYRFSYGNDQGWDRLTFQTGDNVTITFNPSKDGVKGVGLLLRADWPGQNSVSRVKK